MAWTPKVWVDRAVEFAGRRILTPTGNANEYNVTRSEGTVFAVGDEPDATTMNDMETRIGTAITALTPTKKTITWVSGNTPNTSLCYKIGDVVHIDFKMPYSTVVTNPGLVGTLPSDCFPSTGTGYCAIGHANRVSATTYDDSFGIVCRVDADGKIYIANDHGINMYGACVSMEYFIS